jgi:hypothetical protein
VENGQEKSCFWLGQMCLRAGSSKMGCRPYSGKKKKKKKTTKSGLDPVHGFNAFSMGLSSSAILGSASSATAVGSMAPKALGCSLIEFLVSFVHFSSPPKVLSPTAVVEKFSFC